MKLQIVSVREPACLNVVGNRLQSKRSAIEIAFPSVRLSVTRLICE